MNIYVSTILTMRYYIIGSVELKTGRPDSVCVEINMRDYPTIHSGTYYKKDDFSALR
jgi:hypothetical protein